MVEVRKAHRTHNLGHATLAAPCFGGGKKLVDNLFVINEFHPAETHLPLAGLFVGGTVYDSCDCSHRLTVAKCHERLRLAEVPCRIGFGPKGVDIVANQRRHIAVISFVVVDAELHILAKLVGISGYGVNVD